MYAPKTEYSSGLEEASSKRARRTPGHGRAKTRGLGRPLRSAKLLAQDMGDMCRGGRIDTDKTQAEIISIHPSNRGPLNFYRRAASCQLKTERQFKARRHGMFALNPHSCMGQIRHDPLPHTVPAQIIEPALGRDAAVRTEHKSRAFRLSKMRLRCDGHNVISNPRRDNETPAYAQESAQDSQRTG